MAALRRASSLYRYVNSTDVKVILYIHFRLYICTFGFIFLINMCGRCTFRVIIGQCTTLLMTVHSDYNYSVVKVVIQRGAVSAAARTMAY